MISLHVNKKCKKVSESPNFLEDHFFSMTHFHTILSKIPSPSTGEGEGGGGKFKNFFNIDNL